jgi:hypothetical protein
LPVMRPALANLMLRPLNFYKLEKVTNPVTPVETGVQSYLKTLDSVSSTE